MVQGWDRGSPAALDITVTSPLTPATLRDASSTAGAAAYAAECRKHTANDAKCQELGWACIPLAVETFGNWGMEAQGVFSRLASALGMHQGTSKSWALHTIYSRLNMSLVRSVARSILGEQSVIVPSRYQRDWHTIFTVFTAFSFVLESPQLTLRL
ncbi:hypothetical protein EMCRGX_G007891 [Ephydatia muelleri]